MKNKIENNSDFPSRWVTVNGLRIHYKCLGQGPPLLLIHGGGNDWHEWKMNLAYLAQSFQVLALDLPGFGLSQSPAAAISFDWSIEFIKNFMDVLNIKRTHLIGHSLGGMLVIAFAAHYPEAVNKLVLVDASGLGKISPQGRLVISIFRNLDQWQGKRRGPKYIVGSFARDWQVLAELPKIKSSVLIIWGKNDFYLPVAQSRLAHSLIADSQIHIFQHCGHAPQREKSDEFNNLIRQFLNS